MTADRWAVRFAARGARDVRRLDRQVQERVLRALDALSADPYAGRLRKLAGRDEWRLRVGDWRVIVELRDEERLVYVKHVLPRGRAYDR